MSKAKTKQLKTETVDLDSIRQDPRNARAHDERNIGAIVASLRRLCWRDMYHQQPAKGRRVTG